MGADCRTRSEPVDKSVKHIEHCFKCSGGGDDAMYPVYP